jgi:hypothetical protein
MAYTQENNPISRKTSPVLQNFADGNVFGNIMPQVIGQKAAQGANTSVVDGGIPVEKETKKHSLETAEDAPVYKGLVAVKGQPPLQGPPPPPKKDETFLPPSATAKLPKNTYSNEGDPTIYNEDKTPSSKQTINKAPPTFKSGAPKKGPNGQYSIQSTTTY